MTEERSRETYEIDDSALATEEVDPETVGVPDSPGGGRSEPRKEVAREFVIQVMLLNTGLLAVALGLMLLYFRWWVDMGSGLIVLGLLALLEAFRRYKQKAPRTN